MADGKGSMTTFDKAAYEKLITYLTSVDDNINANPSALGTTAELKLDTTLSTRLKPGTKNWPVVQNFTTAAGTFGDSAHQRYVAVEQEMRTFVNALNSAKNVFDDTNDLATYDASKFTGNYPDVGGSSG
jgi:hypothetical protein